MKQTESEATGAHEQSGTNSTSVKQTESEATGAHEQSGMNSRSAAERRGSGRGDGHFGHLFLVGRAVEVHRGGGPRNATSDAPST